jgi:hypothetical protein
MPASEPSDHPPASRIALHIQQSLLNGGTDADKETQQVHNKAGEVPADNIKQDDVD